MQPTPTRRRARLALVMALLAIGPACVCPVDGRKEKPVPIPAVWFLRAGATGDGKTPAAPLGSSQALAAVSQPDDVILLLPSEEPLDGGLALKPRQVLIGVAEGEHKPAITNSQIASNAGHGIVLADGNKVFNIRVVRPQASGVFGADVSDVLSTGR